MPEVLNLPMIPRGPDISRNNGYRFDQEDWPWVSENHEAQISICLAEEDVYLEPWAYSVLVNEIERRDFSFLSNVCKIANFDIKNFTLSSQEYAKWFHSYGRGRPNEKLQLKKVAYSWDLLLRLRLICDIAIILWVKSPNNPCPSFKRRKIDSIYLLLQDVNVVSTLGLGCGACAFLKILNEAANRIKHPTEVTDWIRPYADGEILISRKGITHLIAQPARDLILGTNCFLVTVLGQIKL